MHTGDISWREQISKLTRLTDQVNAFILDDFNYGVAVQEEGFCDNIIEELKSAQQEKLNLAQHVRDKYAALVTEKNKVLGKDKARLYEKVKHQNTFVGPDGTLTTPPVETWIVPKFVLPKVKTPSLEYHQSSVKTACQRAKYTSAHCWHHITPLSWSALQKRIAVLEELARKYESARNSREGRWRSSQILMAEKLREMNERVHQLEHDDMSSVWGQAYEDYRDCLLREFTHIARS